MKPQLRASLLCIGSILLIVSTISAQQRQDPSIAQLKEAVQRLELLVRDPNLSPGSKSVYNSLLEERRTQLYSRLQHRREALQRYLATSRAALGSAESRAVEESILSLESEMAELKNQLSNQAAGNSWGTAPPPIVSTVSGQSLGTASYSPSNDQAQTPRPPTRRASGKGEAATSHAGPAPLQDTEIDACRGKITGDKRKGPATVTVICVNPVKYDNRLEENVTFPPQIDLTLPFIPPVPTTAPQAIPAKNQPLSVADAQQILGTNDQQEAQKLAKLSGDLDAAFNDILLRLDYLDRTRIKNLQDAIDGVRNAVNRATGVTTALVQTSDATLNSQGPVAGPISIINTINTDVLPAINLAVGTGASAGASWPEADVNSVKAEINSLKNSVNTLPSVHSEAWSTWYQGGNKLSYDAVKTRLEELGTIVEAMNTASQSFRDFQDAKNKLLAWRDILRGLDRSSFTLSRHVDCSFSFTGKDTKLTYARRERMTATPTTFSTESEITVACPNPLSVSAGFGFSFVDEREFAFVQSTVSATDQTVIQRFGFTKRSRFRPIPAILLNTLIYEFDDIVSLHASVGAVVDVKTGQGGTGTDLEFIAGPSFALKRILFITPGFHVGRVPELVGGFQVGDRVPTGVNAPPIEKAWKSGFMTTFTFKIR